MPYLEVGQSSSGPLSIAVDMGCRVLASRNGAFLQFERMQPGTCEFFDVGNHAQLATMVQSPPMPRQAPRCTVDTNRRAYLQAFGLA